MKYSKVAIMMSTYNGELYIKEQLTSIVNQEEVKIKLFIRDDGSFDNTINIVNEYVDKLEIEIIKGSHLGAGKSFMMLMMHVLNLKEEFDYYGFADQDDIWFKDKLKRAILSLNNYEPLLYCSNINDYKDNKVVGKFRDSSFKPYTLKQSIIKCGATGNTFVFNNKMAKLFKETKMPCDELLMYRFHDTWIYSLACVYGKIIYDIEPSVNYRIHNNNVSMKKVGYFEKFILSFSKTKHRKGMRSLQAKELLRNCIMIKDKDKKIIQELGEYRNSIKSRIELIKDKEIREISNENMIVFALKVFMGFF